MNQEQPGFYSIDDLCAAAVERQGLKSYNDLGRFIAIKGSAVSQWRTGRTWPSDSTIVRLADAAGWDPDRALLNLQIWRNETKHPEVVERYSVILDRLQKAGAVAGISMMLALANADQATARGAQIAGNIGRTTNTVLSDSVYYGKLLRLFKLWNWLRFRIPILTHSSIWATPLALSR